MSWTPLSCCRRVDKPQRHDDGERVFTVSVIGGLKFDTIDGAPIATSSSTPVAPKMRGRRTSLPAVAITPKGNASYFDNIGRMTEARGMLTDILANRQILPANVVTCLKAVNKLLTPLPGHDTSHLTLPKIVDDPYSGESLLVEQTNKPRASAFSTVTSATGLPTIVTEPSRARSSSFWKVSDIEESTSSEESPSPSKPTDRVYVAKYDQKTIKLAEIEGDEVLNTQLRSWSFPIFDYSKAHPDTLLTRVAWSIFKSTNLNRIFKINPHKFVNFFHALEMGYHGIPYHNRVHATDVLHGVFYLTQHRVPCCEREGEERESGTWRGGSERTMVDGESLAGCMSAMELMALFTAAAMHDYDHPGRTNAFLVATEDKKAILYNDRSVLENHHAASAWSLLTQSDNYFIEHLDTPETKRFRYLVLEFILATDLKRHFEIMMELTSKGDALDVGEETDRLLVCEMAIKMADINAPAKPHGLHMQWTGAVLDEFYAQGDEEKARGMPVSPYMDRQRPQVPKLQSSFIVNMVLPLAEAINDAGLLPCDGEDDEPQLLIHLRRNQEQWDREAGDEMETIVEQEDEESTLL